jgi:hypothetical protein
MLTVPTRSGSNRPASRGPRPPRQRRAAVRPADAARASGLHRARAPESPRCRRAHKRARQCVAADARTPRRELTEHGVQASDVDVQPRGSSITFSDPDGNTRALQSNCCPDRRSLRRPGSTLPPLALRSRKARLAAEECSAKNCRIDRTPPSALPLQMPRSVLMNCTQPGWLLL